MTRDLFNPEYGTLDVIIAAVLLRIGKSATLTTLPNQTTDEAATLNARRFIEQFGDRKIAAIKTVREVTGLGLRDAKDAVEQVYETYGTHKRTFLLTVTLEDDGYEHGLQSMQLADVERLVSDQMAGELFDGALTCTDVDVIEEQETM